MITIRDLREDVFTVRKLTPGETFMFGGELFMFTDGESADELDGATSNTIVVKLTTGETYSFDRDLEVTPVECSVHVYNVMKGEE